MASCPTYKAPFGSQIKQGGSTGPYDCTAWAARVVIATSTCGAKVPSGRTIRLRSSEPVPDWDSPGLNLPQVAEVARRDYGVNMDVQVGGYRLTWSQYEARRKAGQPTEIQVGYGPIADSKYDGGRGFRGNHALAETLAGGTYDSLADGRASGVWRYDGSLYPREIMKRAAGQLDIGGRKLGYGLVWCAFGTDVVPNYRVEITPGEHWFRYFVTNGIITNREAYSGRSTSANCTPPDWYPWPRVSRQYRLVRIADSGSAYNGWYMPAAQAVVR